MPIAVRVTLVVVALVWNIGAAILLERRIHRLLIRLAGASVGRAVAVTVGYQVLVALAWIFFGVVAAITHEVSGTTASLVVCFVALLVAGPFSWALMSPASPDTGGRATVRRELAAEGGDRRVATTMGCLGAVLSLGTGLVGMVTFAILILVLGTD